MNAAIIRLANYTSVQLAHTPGPRWFYADDIQNFARFNRNRRVWVEPEPGTPECIEEARLTFAVQILDFAAIYGAAPAWAAFCEVALGSSPSETAARHDMTGQHANMRGLFAEALEFVPEYFGGMTPELIEAWVMGAPVFACWHCLWATGAGATAQERERPNERFDALVARQQT
jgi:hypothetical protein